jgi:hypothetical protein
MSLFPEYWEDIQKMELSYEVLREAQDKARKEIILQRARKIEEHRRRHRFEGIYRTCIYCGIADIVFHSVRRESVACPKFVEVNS